MKLEQLNKRTLRVAVARAGSALVLLLAGLQSAHAAAEDRAPVPIRTPQVMTPVETAGSGLAPEVEVQVHIDTRGRIDEVEISGIEPTSEFDELFREATRATLLRWRYAPALHQGEPVEAELVWTIRFPSRDEAPEDPVSYARQYGGSGKEDFWDKVLRMGDEQRHKLLMESGKRAKSHLNGENFREHASGRFLVYSDHEDPSIVGKLAGNFEATYNVIGELLAPIVEPLPERYKVLAFVYATRSSYMALNRQAINVDWASGFYSPAGMVATHLEMPSNEAFASTMLHEATHAYLDRHVARAGVRFPRWLGEGFAEYIGNSTIKKGTLIPGRTGRSQIYGSSYGALMGPSGPALTVDEVKQAIKAGTALSVPELMEAEKGAFYGNKHRMYYSMSWLLVHYLRHGQPGWSEREFPTFMLYVAEGFPVPQVLETVYGVTPAQMTQAYREYVKTF